MHFISCLAWGHSLLWAEVGVELLEGNAGLAVGHHVAIANRFGQLGPHLGTGLGGGGVASQGVAGDEGREGKVLSSISVLVASSDYLRRKGTPTRPEELTKHDCLRLKPAAGRSRGWCLLHKMDEARSIEIEAQPVLWCNHTNTLMHAALDGAGITATAIELAAPLVQNSDLAGC